MPKPKSTATPRRTKRRESLLILAEATVDTATDVSAEVSTEVSTRVSEEKIAEHEARMHIPRPRRERIQAIPFPGVRIPDHECAAMLEQFRREACSFAQLADDWGHPLEVVERELTQYRKAYCRWLRELEFA